MICIYHNRDLDGFCSGAIVKRRYPDAVMIGFDYGQSLPELPEGEAIVMIDVSLPMPEMYRLAARSGWNMVWIDHHKSAIEQYKQFLLPPPNPLKEGETEQPCEPFLTAVLDERHAACEIAWKHLFPGERVPDVVELLGKYDTWTDFGTGEWNDLIYPFQFGMRIRCNSVETFPTNMFMPFGPHGLIAGIASEGRLVLKYQAQYSELICRASAFEMDFEGYRCICLNACGLNSETFKSVYDEGKHDIMLLFYSNGKKKTVSLYTKKNIDVSAIAKKYGGGGHKQAAGFTIVVREMPDWL
jgi:hypothetical protein